MSPATRPEQVTPDACFHFNGIIRTGGRKIVSYVPGSSWTANQQAGVPHELGSPGTRVRWPAAAGSSMSRKRRRRGWPGEDGRPADSADQRHGPVRRTGPGTGPVLPPLPGLSRAAHGTPSAEDLRRALDLADGEGQTPAPQPGAGGYIRRCAGRPPARCRSNRGGTGIIMAPVPGGERGELASRPLRLQVRPSPDRQSLTAPERGPSALAGCPPATWTLGKPGTPSGP